MRQNAKGRQAKSKARLARFEEMSNYEYQKRNETQEIFIPVAERLGNEVIEFVNVSKSFGDKVLIDDLSFKVPAGAIVGIIGPNGAGKSTLFKMIAGKEQPDSGEVKIGQTVKMSLIDQSREGLQNDKTVFDNIAEGATFCRSGSLKSPPANIWDASISKAATKQNRGAAFRRRTRTFALGKNLVERRQCVTVGRTV